MSDEHTGEGGMGKTVVVGLFCLMVGFYGFRVMDTSPEAHHEDQHHTEVAPVAPPKPLISEEELQKLKSEKAAALAKVEAVSEQIASATAKIDALEVELGKMNARAKYSEGRLGLVKNILVAEQEVSSRK
jgi:peptidoglycan hydrolase CwlO-like protein